MEKSAVWKALSTPELLDNIFSRLSRRDNTRNALVCRNWADPARDHVWRVVETPCQLFKNLAPIQCPSKSVHSGAHNISRIPTQADWRKFRPLALRVRAVQVTAYSDTRCRGSLSTILSDIAVSRPHDGILPNLRYVDLVGTSLPHGYVTLFLSSNLTSLSSCIPGDSADYGLSDFLEDLSMTAPNLQTLSLVASRNRGNRVTTWQTALGNVATLLPHLTNLKLPLYFLTTTVLEALSESRLSSLEFSETRNNMDNAGDVRDVLTLTPELKANAFSSLRRLSICGSLPDIGSMMSTENFPVNSITDLVVRTVLAESESSVRAFIAFLAERCTSLSCLYFLLMPSNQSLNDTAEPSIVWVDDEEQEPLTMDTLRPLSGMRQLQRFSILHTHPLEVDDDDVHSLVQNLLNLRRLVLNPTPRVRSRSPRLTLLSLIHIANHCPRIHSIALYADAATPLITYPTLIHTPLPKVYLQLGASPLTNITRTEVAKFLSRVLRPGVVLKTTISVFYDIPFPTTNPAWTWITERLPLLLEVRQEERLLQKVRQEEFELQIQTQTQGEQDTQDDNDNGDSEGSPSR
ncbi:hypothetical protein K488DRAFT_88795 [Vararia minispora EC-137]|uniref:Uncharacterized protein n=1 Tax=Vararia minispora EC-137 TaxID=1314806 RepID=A0ACB8QDK7_9AGAM|nr:hypothetical protein K488DRAFT_88795 [Vararia minispora EC-137]